MVSFKSSGWILDNKTMYINKFLFLSNTILLGNHDSWNIQNFFYPSMEIRIAWYCSNVVLWLYIYQMYEWLLLKGDQITLQFTSLKILIMVKTLYEENISLYLSKH